MTWMSYRQNIHFASHCPLLLVAGIDHACVEAGLLISWNQFPTHNLLARAYGLVNFEALFIGHHCTLLTRFTLFFCHFMDLIIVILYFIRCILCRNLWSKLFLCGNIYQDIGGLSPNMIVWVFDICDINVTVKWLLRSVTAACARDNYGSCHCIVHKYKPYKYKAHLLHWYYAWYTKLEMKPFYSVYR